MCESARRDAAPRVGYVLLGTAQGIRSNPPPNRSVEEREQVISFYTNGLAAGAVGPSWLATERERNAATTQALQEQLQQTEQMHQQQLFQQREDYLLRNAINPPRPPDFR